jgi:hypothetical protein
MPNYDDTAYLLEQVAEAKEAIEDLKALKAKDPHTFRSIDGQMTLVCAEYDLADSIHRLQAKGIFLDR